MDYRIRRDSDPDRVLVTHIDNLKPYEGPLALDIDIQAAPPDDQPMAGPQDAVDLPVDDHMLNVLGIPEPEPHDAYDTSEADLGPSTSRPRRQRAGRPPARYGWD